MKYIALLTSLCSIVPLLSSAQTATTVSFDQVYDNAAQSLNVVACSTGSNGLITRGFTTFGSLPKFPHIGGAPAVTGFNSPACGTCWELAFTNSSGVRKTIDVLAIDVAVNSFNIALAAMNELTNNQAIQLGRVNIISTQVNASVCGL